MKKDNLANDFIKLEKDVLDFWEKQDIFKKMKNRNKDSKKYYAFLDGPMTANNKMGIHHAQGRTLKDIYIKFKSMDGFDTKFQNGFDAHGLPVEIAVEKANGIANKKEIHKFGLDKFMDKCIERVDEYGKIITNQSKRLGQLMDWDSTYYTNTDNNVTAIWHFLKECDKRGWIVKNSKPMIWCPRCGTSLSDHEMHGSYKEIEHEAVFFKANLKDFTDRSLLVWTTTPWTLTSNVAVAISRENIYCEVKVKSAENLLIVGKEALKILKGDLIEVVREFPGEELIGLEYEPILNCLEIQQFTHNIVEGKDVSATEGTGAVHIAPGCGVEDFELGVSLNLRQICPIDEEGKILPDFGKFAGYTTKEVKQLIFDDMKENNKLYYSHMFKHSYQVCWRCKEEIVYRLVDGWFIKADEIRPQLIKAIDDVTFEPEYLKKRMLDWLNNLGDWNISRSRFYGVPLPIYPCSCGHVHIVGSLDELKELSSKEQVEKIPHLHKPYLDDLMIKCPKCGKPVKRIPEVGDCWLDAGITPFSTTGYFEDRAEWEKNFPSQVVIEMREQIRLWFYSLLFMSVVLEGRAPYKKLIGHEAVVQEDGSKFSKSGVSIVFDDFADKLGADSARYLYAGTPLQSVTRFGYQLGEESRRKMLGLWNAYTFFNTYACIDNPQIDNFTPNENQFSVTDKWLVQLINDFVKKSYDNYNNNRAYDVVADYEDLIDKLTNFYIRGNRRRFWKSLDDNDKRVAYWVLYQALKSITIVMTPIIPFMGEYLWQNLVKEIEPNEVESVMLSSFAQPIYHIDFSQYINYTEIARDVMNLGGRLRNENQLKVKQPLNKAFVVSDNKNTLKAINEYKELIKEELNIKNIEVTDSVTMFNDYYLTINFKECGKVLKSQVQNLKNYLENLTHDQMQSLVNEYDNNQIEIAEFGSLDASLFNKNSKAKDEFVLAKEQDITVVLDTHLTPELINEGLLRELIRNAQVLRKEADFKIDARVDVRFESDDEQLTQIILDNKDKIMSEVLAVSFNEQIEAQISKQVEVGQSSVQISLKENVK